MTFLKHKLALILSIGALLVTTKANAYDVDTHFYGTYAMARFAGIKPDIAEKLATSAQWMDESYLSDPTSMILMPITGVQKRRLLHFPASRVTGSLSGSIRDESFGIKEPTGFMRYIVNEVVRLSDFQGDLRVIAFNSATESNHEFASALIMQGLKEGNLMKVGAGLHTLEDSYAHAGTAPIEGHAHVWHWPDRPFAAFTKYQSMTLSVFKTMVAVRAQLPTDAIDCSLSQFGKKPTCEMTAAELHAVYANHPLVTSTVKRNVLRDQRYIRFALHDTLRRAIALNYFKSVMLPDGRGLEALLEETLNSSLLVGRVDAYGILGAFFQKTHAMEKLTGQSILNLDVITKDMGLISDPTIPISDMILSMSGPLFGSLDGYDPTAGFFSFEHMIALRLLSGYVPIPLSEYHRVEKEDDEAVTRQFEMKLRIENMQALITKLFGDKIEFVENSTKDEVGFVHEVLEESEANPKFEKLDAGTKYATFTAKEKYTFNLVIFQYMFPHLTETDLKKIAKVMQKAKQAKPLNYIFAAAKIAKAILPIIKPFTKDLANEHLAPVGDEKFYQNAELFERYKLEKSKLGMFPKFLGPKDAWPAK